MPISIFVNVYSEPQFKELRNIAKFAKLFPQFFDYIAKEDSLFNRHVYIKLVFPTDFQNILRDLRSKFFR